MFLVWQKVEGDKLGNLVNIGNLLMGLIDRMTIVDQNWHSACRVHVSQVLDTLTKNVWSLFTEREGLKRKSRKTFALQPQLCKEF